MKNMEVNSLFSAAQHGFVTGKSGSTQLLELMEELTEALDSNVNVDIIYLDFAKAFDKCLRTLVKTLRVYYPRKGSQLGKRILDRQVAKSRNRRQKL